jgi:hypothetical protein
MPFAWYATARSSSTSTSSGTAADAKASAVMGGHWAPESRHSIAFLGSSQTLARSWKEAWLALNSRALSDTEVVIGTVTPGRTCTSCVARLRVERSVRTRRGEWVSRHACR